jgi:predicted ATPase
VGGCSVADVGVGVSQVLPILVALLAAVPRQIVHVEQPELHLHPGAQSRLVRILSDAAKRGVLVVVETHSPLILLGVQTLVANGTLAPNMVALNWFSLTSEGSSQVVRRDLDERGRVSDWPEDFGKVTLAAQKEYLLASLKRSGR